MTMKILIEKSMNKPRYGSVNGTEIEIRVDISDSYQLGKRIMNQLNRSLFRLKALIHGTLKNNCG